MANGRAMSCALCGVRAEGIWCSGVACALSRGMRTHRCALHGLLHTRPILQEILQEKDSNIRIAKDSSRRIQRTQLGLCLRL